MLINPGNFDKRIKIIKYDLCKDVDGFEEKSEVKPLAKIKMPSKKNIKHEKIANYSGEKSRRITGVKRSTFEKMVEILKKGYAEKHRRRGRNQKLSIEDLLLATLEYLRESRTYAHIAASYDVSESNLYRGIRWVEGTLIKDGTFSLSGRKALLKSEAEYKVILVYATETPGERPPKKKVDCSGKKKRHTFKNKMLINPEKGEIISLVFAKGKGHDSQLFKSSKIHLKSAAQL